MTGYSVRVRQLYPVLGPYLHIIDRWLTADRESPRKQRHTARRIYHRLQYEHDYQGSEEPVRHYVRPAKIRLGLKTDTGFLPSDPELGPEAEADDFFEMVDTARFLEKGFDRRPEGPARVAVLTYSGASGIVSADHLDEHRLDLAALSPETTKRLQEKLPPGCRSTITWISGLPSKSMVFWRP